jgi:Thioredoxin
MRIISVVLLLGLLGMAALFHFFKTEEPQIIGRNEDQKPHFQKMSQKYCIHYGSHQAPIKIIEFFSFQCPHCIKLFRNDFLRIKQDLIDTGKLYFEFHPVPHDLPTAQAMICFERLEEKEKHLFLEAIFEEAIPTNPELMTKLMMAAMNVFKKPVPFLNDENYLKEHQAFEEIYRFLKQEIILAVPTLEVNGRLFAAEVPDYQFIKSFIKD